ncbi:MAG: transglycosylase SLT domain-containing protein [Thermaerobacter sp.]|nr:transglycosylase SLT domain-containing protein [Thermaerobacter sp.]
MAEEKTLDQRLLEEAERQAAKRVWYWVLGGGLATVGPVLLIIIVVFAGVALLAGIGAWVSSLFGPSPPAIATPMSRPTEWLSTISQSGAKYGVPNVIALAVVQQASDGEVYGDRYYCSNGQSAGEQCSTAFPGHKATGGVHAQAAVPAAKTLGLGLGLFGIGSQSGLIPQGQSPHSVSWNVGTGTQQLGKYLTATDWQSGLTAFHQHVQTPAKWQSSGQYATQIKGLVQEYSSGPTLGAWALAGWSHKTGQFQDPGNAPEWVFAVGSAPTGLHGSHTWSPPTITRIQKSRTAKPKTIIIRHLLSYTEVSGPLQVWGTLKSGTNVSFVESATTGPGSKVPVWGGGQLWGAKVPLTGQSALKTITARWSNGAIMTMPWPETGGQQGVVVWHLLSNPQAIQKWWPDIQAAGRQTGAPAPLIGSIMIHESGGDATIVNPAGPAYGLMQILSTTAPGLAGYAPGWQTNGALNLLMGAQLLEQDYQQTGSVSWREAVCAYYGGLGSMEQLGYKPGMPWSQAAPLLNVIPGAGAGNVQTMTAYADQMHAEMATVASEATAKTSAKKG